MRMPKFGALPREVENPTGPMPLKLENLSYVEGSMVQEWLKEKSLGRIVATRLDGQSGEIITGNYGLKDWVVGGENGESYIFTLGPRGEFTEGDRPVIQFRIPGPSIAIEQDTQPGASTLSFDAAMIEGDQVDQVRVTLTERN